MAWWHLRFNGHGPYRYESDGDIASVRVGLLARRARNALMVLTYDDTDVFVDWSNIAVMEITAEEVAQ